MIFFYSSPRISKFFYPHFSNLYHFSPKIYDFLQKTTKIHVFSGKFTKNPRKTQGPFENPRKNPRPSEKNPRTQDCFEKPKILGENPSTGNAYNVTRISRAETYAYEFLINGRNYFLQANSTLRYTAILPCHSIQNGVSHFLIL